MDTAYLQGLLNQGGDVTIPPGQYTVAKSGPSWCLTIQAGTRLRAEGVVIRMADNQPPSTWCVKVTGADVAIEGLALEGGSSPPDEHRHGLFVTEASGLHLEGLRASGFTGDGVYLYKATGVTLDDVECSGNFRNGLTLGGDVSHVTCNGCVFEDNGAQQVDSEPHAPARVSYITLHQCLISAGRSNDYVLTMSGTPEAPGGPWEVTGCDIRGGTYIYGACDVLFGWNHVENATTKSCVEVWASSARVKILGNWLEATQTTFPAAPVVYVLGTHASGPEGVLVAGNSIYGASKYGVWAQAAVSCDVSGNWMEGALGGAIVLRSSLPSRPFVASATDNYVLGYGTSVVLLGEGQFSQGRNTSLPWPSI